MTYAFTSIAILLYHVEHLYCRLDGRFRLVGVKSARTKDLLSATPCDDRLHEGVSSVRPAEWSRHSLPI